MFIVMSWFSLYCREDYLRNPEPVDDYFKRWCGMYLPVSAMPDTGDVTSRLYDPSVDMRSSTFVCLCFTDSGNTLGGVILDYHAPSGVLWVSCLVRRKSVVFKGLGRRLLEEAVRLVRERVPEVRCVLFEVPRTEAVYSGAGCMLAGDIRRLALSWGAKVVAVGYLSFSQGVISDGYDLFCLPEEGLPEPDRVCLIRFFRDMFRKAGKDPRCAEEVIYTRPYVPLLSGYRKH